MADHRRLAILGASGAIGRVLCQRAAESGWQVIAMDLPTSLTAHPTVHGEAIGIDLLDPDSVATAFAKVGPLDGFVNLAGFMSPLQTLGDTALDVFDEIVSVNLRGAFIAAKAALPLLQVRGGAMVNVASGLAAHARPGFGPYSATKAGMVSLTKTLALEAAPSVRVNAVGPSALDTDFLRGGTGRERTDRAEINLDAIASATPLKRIAIPDDVAGPVLFLLSDAAAFMTGQVLWVNGGSYMP